MNHLLLANSLPIIFDYDIENDIMSLSIRMEDGERKNIDIPHYAKELSSAGTVHGDSVEDIRAMLRTAGKKSMEGTLDYRANYFGRGYDWYRMFYRSLTDDTGKVFHILGRADDIQGEKEAAEALRQKAEYDALTGLYNRATAEELMIRMLHLASPESPVAHLFFDIDAFKAVNDHYGYPRGDLLLTTIGEIVRDTCRKTDICGRIGGDEFAIMLLNVKDAAGAVKKADEIREKTIAQAEALRISPPPTLSMGVVFTQEPISYAELFRRADHALYQAKNSGKNRCVLYTPQP